MRHRFSVPVPANSRASEGVIDHGSKSVLLTGASGFLGRHCVERLTGAGFEVHAVRSPRSEEGEDSAAVWHRADLLDHDEARGLVEKIQPSHLLHLAWYGDRDFYHSVRNFAWVEASLGLLRHFGTNGGRRVVMAGSSAEYDWNRGACSEDETSLVPATVYGSCKRALGLLFEAFVGATDVRGAWARIFFTYGPGQGPQHLVGNVVSSLLEGRRVEVRHGGLVRDYLYVEDVADALVTLLKSEVEGAINIGSGNPTCLRDLVLGAARRLEAVDHVDFGAVGASDQASSVLADIHRLRRELGWQPSYSLDQGLDRTVAWWRGRLEGGAAEGP